MSEEDVDRLLEMIATIVVNWVIGKSKKSVRLGSRRAEGDLFLVSRHAQAKSCRRLTNFEEEQDKVPMCLKHQPEGTVVQ